MPMPLEQQPVDPATSSQQWESHADTGERDRINAFLLRQASELVTTSDERTVLQRLCDALVAASPHIRLAWIWIGSPDVQCVEPQVMAGPARAYAQMLRIRRNWLTRMGPVFQVLLGAPDKTMRVGRLSLFGPWRRAAARYGFAEAIAMRLDMDVEDQFGVVVFYADQADYFERVGIEPFHAFITLARSMLHQCRIVRQLEQQAITDPLTGLLNRRGMQAELDRAFADYRAGLASFALILLDLDRFKLLNDTHGHRHGDAALVHVAQLLRTSIRPQDAVARWGGEEFLVLLNQATLQQASASAERLRQKITTTPLELEGKASTLSASLGVAMPLDQECSAERLLSRLDALLYDAKRAGRNTVRTQQPQQSLTLSIGAQLQQALDAKRIRVAYQPLVDLRDERVIGFEALARLQTADGAILPAASFIDAAHRLRLEHRVDAQVIAQALQHCAQLAQGSSCGQRHLLNCSADFLSRAECLQHFLQQAQAAFALCGLQTQHPKPVIIEITERQFLHNPGEARRHLQPLLDFGFELAIDDFGSGYSSFLYVLDLPVHYLKIEMALVQRAASEPKAQVLLRSIVAMAQELNIRTIAEGVETPTMRDLMRDLGIDWGQGYLWGKPRVDLHQTIV